MKKLILFMNGNLGLQILDFLSVTSDVKVSAIVLNADNKSSTEYFSKVEKLISRSNSGTLLFKYSKDLWDNRVFQKVLEECTHAISALFGHKIPSQVISEFDHRIINLHPSLLPHGRGADPIPWGIIENVQQGVTIHLLTEQFDSGPIVAQKALDTSLSMNAGEIYDYAINELFKLFKSIQESWFSGDMQLNIQSGTGSFHDSSELNRLRTEILFDGTRIEEVVRIISALTFSDGRNAKFKAASGEIWNIKVLLEPVTQSKENNESNA